MGCYCGLETKENKIKWGVFGGCTVLAIIFFFLYWSVQVQGVRDIDECMERYEAYSVNSPEYIAGEKYCRDESYDKEGAKLQAFFILFLAFAISSSIPLYMMCCCTDKPDAMPTHVVQAVGKVAYQHI